jgi:uncharacterized protein
MATPPESPPKPRTWRQRLGRWFLVALTGYLGAIVMLMLLENWFVYRPYGADNPDDWRPAPSPRIQDVTFPSAAGDTIHGWWLPWEGATGALIYFHGNAGNLSWRGNSIFILAGALGQSVLIIDYPGYGKSSGRPSEAGCYAAADAAYEWVTKTQRIEAENILLYGGSLGGGVAVDLASRQPHRALILVKTFTSLPDVGASKMPYFPVRLLMRNQFNSLSKLSRCKQPIFIAHGDADTLVPYSQGKRLYEAAPGPKEFLTLPGADHNDQTPEVFYLALKKFLAETAPVPAAAN